MFVDDRMLDAVGEAKRFLRAVRLHQEALEQLKTGKLSYSGYQMRTRSAVRRASLDLSASLAKLRARR